MRSSLRLTFRRLAAETSGAEIAETAAVLPLMFMILLGIFWFGQAFRTYGTITRAAQDGARAAVAPQCTTCGPATSTPAANALTAVQSALVAAKLDPANLHYISGLVPSLNSCVDGSAVACDASTTRVCVQVGVRLSDAVTGSGVCGTSVSFQYPYQFWLPFTTLNKQLIQLNAASQQRLETH
jgi:Flp pilus assembly protein TadG